jgi:hypothetical protein
MSVTVKSSSGFEPSIYGTRLLVVGYTRMLHLDSKSQVQEL